MTTTVSNTKMSTPQTMSDEVMSCIFTGITVARDLQVRRAKALREHLKDRDFSDETITEAFCEIGKRLTLQH